MNAPVSSPHASTDSVEIVIQPIADKAIEGDEVIGLALKEPVCVKIFPPPPDCPLGSVLLGFTRPDRGGIRFAIG